jgi:hypothetical protein
VESKLKLCPLLEPHLYTPSPVSVLFLDPTVYQTRPPLLSGLFHSAIYTCQETGPWIHCIIINR